MFSLSSISSWFATSKSISSKCVSEGFQLLQQHSVYFMKERFTYASNLVAQRWQKIYHRVYQLPHSIFGLHKVEQLANTHGFTILTVFNANQPKTSKWGRSKVVGLDFCLDFNNCIHINKFPHTFKQDFNVTFLQFEFIRKLSIFKNPNFHPFLEVCYSCHFQFIYRRKGVLLLWR